MSTYRSYFEPLSVIQGEVRPPATFLGAEEILQRQYVAHIVDQFARDPQPRRPRMRVSVLGDDRGRQLAGPPCSRLAATDAEQCSTASSAQFGQHLSADTVAAYGRGPAPPPEGGSERTHPAPDGRARTSGDSTSTNSPPGWPPSKPTCRSSNGARLHRRPPTTTAVPFRSPKVRANCLEGRSTRSPREYWISVLERYGVLPNYTLLDDAVTLDVGVTWIDPDTNEYFGDERQLSARLAGRAHRTRARRDVLRPGPRRDDRRRRPGHRASRISMPGRSARSAVGREPARPRRRSIR